MKIDHIAIWTRDIERIRNFYQTYFKMKCSDKYLNNKKGFTSYFLFFASGARIEIMSKDGVKDAIGEKGLIYGLTHFSISVGSIDDVDKLTERFRIDGYTIFGEPRYTGDGYYESIVLDPEGNQIEITE